MPNIKKGFIVKSAAVLGIGTFVAKILGAIYRVPLTNIIGGYGLGLYQTVFPVYAVLLDFAGAGVPSALSKLISSKKQNAEKSAVDYLYASVKLLAVIGGIFSLLVAFASFSIARIQGDANAGLSYVTLAPSVFLVAIISAYRGYFQGLADMKPTALSQIVEQGVKLAFGLTLASIFSYDIPLAVALCTLSVTLSELVALIFLKILFIKRRKRENLAVDFRKKSYAPLIKEVALSTIPVTLIGIAIPVSQVIDSFLIINLLSYTENPTALYGLFSGAVATVINLPVAVCYGISTATIPAVASAKTENEAEKNQKRAIVLTFFLSLLGATVVFILPNFITGILFGGLDRAEKSLVTDMLKYSAPSVLFLSLLQTENAVLIGKNKLYFPLIGLILGITVKIILNLLLISDVRYNIYGAVVSQIACYFTASLINLFLIIGESNGCKVLKLKRITT